MSLQPLPPISTEPVHLDFPPFEPEPALPDLFSDMPTASVVSAAVPAPAPSEVPATSSAVPSRPPAGSGFLPPPALVSPDAPDEPMAGSAGRVPPTPAAPGAAVADGDATPTKGRARKTSKNAKPGKNGGRPAWIIPAIGAAAVVAGGIYLVSSRDSAPTRAATPTTRSARPSTSASAAPSSVATTAAAGPASSVTTTAVLAPTSSVAESAAIATTATTASIASTTAPTLTTTATTVASTTVPPPVPSEFPPPSVVTGTGNRTFNITLSQQASVVLEASHKGTRNFIVKALDAKGATLAVPINQVGAFSGSVVLAPAASLQVTADGAWSVTIKPLLSARQIGSQPANGKGSEVVLYAGPAVRAAVSHGGQRTFKVEYHTKEGTTTVLNEVGNYQGSIDLPEGITVLGIVADGAWTLTPGS